jgi:hypothetical protein
MAFKNPGPLLHLTFTTSAYFDKMSRSLTRSFMHIYEPGTDLVSDPNTNAAYLQYPSQTVRLPPRAASNRGLSSRDGEVDARFVSLPLAKPIPLNDLVEESVAIQ